MGILLLKRATQPVLQFRDVGRSSVTVAGTISSQASGTGTALKSTVRPNITVASVSPSLARGIGTIGRTIGSRPNVPVAARTPSGSLGGALEQNWVQRQQTVTGQGGTVIHTWRPTYGSVEKYILQPSGNARLGPWTGGTYSFGTIDGAASNWNNVCWKLDPVIKRSGSYSFHSRIPAGGGSDSGGAVRFNWVDDVTNVAARNAAYALPGTTRYIQFMFRCNAAIFDAWQHGDRGFKQMIIGSGDQEDGPPINQNDDFFSCTNVEVVANAMNYGACDGRGIAAYHSCSGQGPPGPPQGWVAFTEWTPNSYYGSPTLLQNGVATCPYPAPAGGAGCVLFQADTWCCIEIEIKVVQYTPTRRGRLRMWAAPNADTQDAILIGDTNNVVGADNFPLVTPSAGPQGPGYYGKCWILNYTTNLDHTQTEHYDTWTTEVIVADRWIPFPFNPTRTTPP